MPVTSFCLIFSFRGEVDEEKGGARENTRLERNCHGMRSLAGGRCVIP